MPCSHTINVPASLVSDASLHIFAHFIESRPRRNYGNMLGLIHNQFPRFSNCLLCHFHRLTITRSVATEVAAVQLTQLVKADSPPPPQITRSQIIDVYQVGSRTFSVA